MNIQLVRLLSTHILVQWSPAMDLNIKVSKILYIIEPILLFWNITFTFYYMRVRPQCDYSILGQRIWQDNFSGQISILPSTDQQGGGLLLTTPMGTIYSQSTDWGWFLQTYPRVRIFTYSPRTGTRSKCLQNHGQWLSQSNLSTTDAFKMQWVRRNGF